MARYDITHACGHTEPHQIYGTNARGERERAAASKAKRPCPACRREQADRANRQAAESARYSDAAESLPELTGSDRQIPWGTWERRAALDRLRAELAEHFPADAAAELYHDALNLAGRYTRTDYWIDHRHSNGRYLWRQLLREADPESRQRILDRANTTGGA